MNVSNVCNAASSNSVTSDFWRLDENHVIQGKIFASFLLSFELIGLPWNVLVLTVILKEKLFNQPTVILLLNLLTADFFLLLYPSPLLITTGFAGEFIIGPSDKVRCEMCQLSFALLVPFYSTLFTVALMSLDRFLYIYKPFWYERPTTKYFAIVAVVVAVFVSITIGLTARLDPHKLEFNSSILECTQRIDIVLWYPIVLVIIGVAVLMVLIVSNIWFAYIVLKNIRAVYKSNEFEAQTDESKWTVLKTHMRNPRYQKEANLYRMFLTLLLSSLIIWIPFLYDIGSFIITNTYVPLNLSIVAQILLYSQVVVHPVTETMLLAEIRKPLKDMVTCGILKRSKNERSIQTNVEPSCITFASKGHCCFTVKLLEAGLVTQNMPGRST